MSQSSVQDEFCELIVIAKVVYGEKDANNAGEYLSIDKDSGDLMVYCDSDTVGGGFAYLKLSPT